MSKENVTIVRNGYDAFRRGDIEVIFDTLDPGVEFGRDGSPCKSRPAAEPFVTGERT